MVAESMPCLMRACVQASRCASRTRKSGATSAALKPTSTPRKRGSRRGVRVPRPCAAAERTIVRKPVPLCAAVEACKKSSFMTLLPSVTDAVRPPYP